MAIKSQSIKYSGRERSKIRIRKRMFGTDSKPRISVFKSLKHIYVQAISDVSGLTLASASTLDEDVIKQLAELKLEDGVKTKSSKSMAAAKTVGLILAKRLQEKNIVEGVFDRNGFVYHGRIKAVADGAREGGIKFNLERTGK